MLFAGPTRCSVACPRLFQPRQSTLTRRDHTAALLESFTGTLRIPSRSITVGTPRTPLPIVNELFWESGRVQPGIATSTELRWHFPVGWWDTPTFRSTRGYRRVFGRQPPLALLGCRCVFHCFFPYFRKNNVMENTPT